MISDDFQFLSDLEDQMSYYDKKSISAQREYYILAITNLCSTALIPIVSIASDDFWFIKYIVALLGTLSTICTGLLHLKKPKERWMQSRLVCQRLDTERMLFKSQTSPYDDVSDVENQKRFVTYTVEIMRQELEDWHSTAQQSTIQESK